MRISQLFYQTQKEVPRDAQIPSHQLMIRAGRIQQLATGMYNYLPLAHKSIRKIETIIREELEKKGCQEVLLPVVQPAELWEKSGRWGYYGPELLRFKDRKNGDFCLGPTHEEVITDMVSKVLKSYKQLPWNLFQIQGKFRDEVRPRFGLMRGREFIMKDGYSFDTDEERSKVTYWKMYEAYTAIFKRCGLTFRAVDAATGNIGGDMSHEFQVLAKTGEDMILSCDRCDYAANAEKAVTPRSAAEAVSEGQEVLEDVHTPGSRTIEEVSEFLKRDGADFIKSIVYMIDEEAVLVLIRGDLEINESKLQTLCSANGVVLADDSVVREVTGVSTGFAGPVGLQKEVKIVADYSVTGRLNMVSGANRDDYHKLNVNYLRDFKADILGDLSFASEGDLCPKCEGKLEEHRGIEVGQVFFLGTKYSIPMECSYLDKDGKSQPAVMGCYGIGVGRTMAASIEQNHDEDGIIWPVSIAPFEVIILPLQMNKEEVVEAGNSLYESLKSAGIDVALDDRDERAGFKFKDADLIGYPLQIVIGARSLEAGEVEIKIRKTGEKKNIPLGDALSFALDFIREEKKI
ncbi:proline--tRNA ligase [Oceanispirochaeta sp.]|jgi:prolyl-tRNA synthetase|uniref:proline--tRNA ligase n=1 Tax=Oceanispirochaeta sp. TaxID=2035350 RepID=UPI002619F8DD|nr:proline--tRNA ligase [Oceanispirochaeta sp.]MDA3956450.1 proline--tRNA ligase [Oceanispirochaeta sp.]